MKRLFIYATAGALSITAMTSFNAYAAGTYNVLGQKGNVVVIGGSISGNGDLSSIMEQIQGVIQENGIDCPVIPDLPDWNPGGDGQPDHDQPENGFPEVDQPESDMDETDFAAQVAALVNQERAKAGLAPLTVNARAAAAAQVRAKEITTSFSHTRPDGSSFSTALKEAGVSFRRSGENIAYGQRSPQAVMDVWMNSSGHRANILNPNFTEIGVGHYTNAAGVSYWTQLFIN